MTFEELLDQAIDMLRRRGRATYRALKLQFHLDDDTLEALKDEILYAQPQVQDDAGRGLVWTETSASASAPVHGPDAAPAAASFPGVASSATQSFNPRAYTPPHLVEKILTSHATLHGERKQVTVLFCDLANSTGLAEQLGPEAMHTVLNQFFAHALAAVHRYEGTINQFLGDGFMALFGAPITHEDHARRAVLAALELRRRLQAYNAAQAQGVELAVRIGINTGLVVVGAIGDNLRMDYTAVGDTTNVAARLEHEATPDQIVISEATYRLVADYCTTRDLGAFALRGKAAPVRAWEVTDARVTRTRLDVAVERGLTPLVGRGRELRTLHDCFARAQAGRGQVVFLVGEAGIGKSRLLWEFRQQLGETQATWLEGHALSFGQSMAFHPMIDLLKRNFRIEDWDPEPTIIAKIERGVLLLGEELRPMLPYVRHLLGVDPGDEVVRTMDPQLRQGEMFAALRRLLLRAAEVRPQVIVFEDLHWMDRATEALLMATADSIPTSRILLLCTYRPGYHPPLGDRTYHTRLVLTNLSAADSVQMAQAMLDSTSLPEALTSLIVQKAEGNPFFVEEMVKSLQEAGDIRLEEGRYVLARPLDEIVVPDTIQDILMARIDRLAEAPKQTLQLAAVIGREFTHRLLDRLATIQERTETSLQELKALELIHEKSLFPELSYMFKHALTLDVTYNSLLMQRRKELHGAIGRAIEELYADRLPEQYAVLAYHFMRGEAWDKALASLLKAAERAAEAFALREAIALYDQGLEVAGHLGPAVDGKTLMMIHRRKAAFYYTLSDFESCLAEHERCLRLARQVGDRMSEGTALTSMGWAAVWAHDFERALMLTRQGIAVAEEMDAQRVLASGHFNNAFVYAITARLAQAQEEITQALTISQAVGDSARQAASLSTAGLLKNWQGDYAEAARLQSEGVRLARERRLLLPLLTVLIPYSFTLVGKGDFDEALAAIEEGLSLTEKLGHEVLHHRLLNTLGWLYFELGSLEYALTWNQRGAAAARARGDAETIANAELNLGDTLLAQGDLLRAQEVFEGVHRLVHDPATSEWMKWRYSIHLCASLGELWLARENPRKAHEFADRCVHMATRTHSRKYLVKGWRLKGEIALSGHRWAEAESAFHHALTMAQAIHNPTQLWKTYLALGRFRTATQRHAQAHQAYRAACDVLDRIKAQLQTPELRTSLEQAPMIQQVYATSMSDV